MHSLVWCHTVDGNKKSGINSPVEVGSWNPMIYKVLAPSLGGWPWDFWTINSIKKAPKLLEFSRIFPTSLEFAESDVPRQFFERWLHARFRQGWRGVASGTSKPSGFCPTFMWRSSVLRLAGFTGVYANMGFFPKMVVPPKHHKMIIFSRKTHGCWVPPF